MSGDDAFEVEGLILEALPNRTWRVELSNGHRLTGFVTGSMRAALDTLTPGSKVRLKLSPFDLSEGRIVGKQTI
jgi:translation initiation factor IF-1